MKTLLCGGTCGVVTRKPSKIAQLFADELHINNVFNGTVPEDVKDHDLIIWMPDFPNDQENKYPKKDKGSVLICSKVMREGYTDTDAVTRIFKMQGNAVIKIYKDEKMFRFQLTDALGNNWTKKTTSIAEVAKAIRKLYFWTKGSERKSLKHEQLYYPFTLNTDFVDLIKTASQRVMNGTEERFFGNYSTRCTKLFPSERVIKGGFLFSPRNVDKQFIEPEDCVYCTEDTCFGNRKPSVDAPIQIEIYKKFPIVNYMIHGHAYIKNAPVTKDYFPCGDMREVDGIVDIMNKGVQVLNLKNHGFLITATNLAELEIYVNMCNFYIPDVNNAD